MKQLFLIFMPMPKCIKIKYLFYIVSFCCLFQPAILHAQSNEIVIDAVVASVDGKPITLQDISKRLNPPRLLDIRTASKDNEVKNMLEVMIIEKLIQLEAESKKLGVSKSEIEEYINEVATRNNMTRQAFEAALAKENKSLEEYKAVLTIDILKSKLTSNYIKGTVSVSNEEIDEYINEHSEYSKSGSKIKLRQILVKLNTHTEDEARQIIDKAQAELQSGKDFIEVAKKYSEGAEAKEGGSLGLLAEEDLSRDILDAVLALKPGELSPITTTAAGLHIFKLDERLAEKKQDDDSDGDNKTADPVREEVKKILLNQKMQDKMATFFTADIYKLHSVDRKI